MTEKGEWMEGIEPSSLVQGEERRWGDDQGENATRSIGTPATLGLLGRIVLTRYRKEI